MGSSLEIRWNVKNEFNLCLKLCTAFATKCHRFNQVTFFLSIDRTCKGTYLFLGTFRIITILINFTLREEFSHQISSQSHFLHRNCIITWSDTFRMTPLIFLVWCSMDFKVLFWSRFTTGFRLILISKIIFVFNYGHPILNFVK